MRNRMRLSLVCTLLCAVAAFPMATLGHEGAQEGDPAPGVNLENLLKAELVGFDGAEVVVSRVTLPPHTSLPKHWHPGEEFAYILEGSAVLWQDGKDEIVGKAGDVLKVPLKQVHTAITRDEGAVILVFRVHEQGKPERVPVE